MPKRLPPRDATPKRGGIIAAAQEKAAPRSLRWALGPLGLRTQTPEAREEARPPRTWLSLLRPALSSLPAAPLHRPAFPIFSLPAKPAMAAAAFLCARAAAAAPVLLCRRAQFRRFLVSCASAASSSGQGDATSAPFRS